MEDYRKEIRENIFEKRAKEIQKNRLKSEKTEDLLRKKIAFRIRLKTFKAPYISSSWLQRFFELNRRQKIDKVDKEFISLYIIGSGNEFKVISALRFLNLIDDNLNATQKLLSLRSVGQEFQNNLKLITEEAYSDLISTIVLERAKTDDLINFFIQRYNYSTRVAQSCTKLFLWLALKSDIRLSKELQVFAVRTKKRRIAPRKTIKPAISNQLGIEPYRAKSERDMVIKSKSFNEDKSLATLKSEEFSFSVKRDIYSVEFARSQINAMLDYLERKLKKEI